MNDDGRGIDLEKIKAIAVEKNLADAKISDAQSVAELIFHPGFTTSGQVTQISGRGVGMDAVRSLLEKHGGGCYLHFPEEPSNLTMTPVSFVVEIGATYFELTTVGEAS